jgi:hypothetical protein
VKILCSKFDEVGIVARNRTNFPYFWNFGQQARCIPATFLFSGFHEYERNQFAPRALPSRRVS